MPIIVTFKNMPDPATQVLKAHESQIAAWPPVVSCHCLRDGKKVEMRLDRGRKFYHDLAKGVKQAPASDGAF